MSRFICGGFQSLVSRIVPFSIRQVRSTMAAAGYSSENDVRDDAEKDDADDPLRISDSDEAESHTELANGDSATGSQSKTEAISDVLDCGLSFQKQQSSDCSIQRTGLGQEKACSPAGVLFLKDQPRRQFHYSLWSNSDEGYRTREQVVKGEKGKQTSFNFTSCSFIENLKR